MAWATREESVERTDIMISWARVDDEHRGTALEDIENNLIISGGRL